MKWNSNKNAQADGGDRTGEKARTVGKIRGGRHTAEIGKSLASIGLALLIGALFIVKSRLLCKMLYNVFTISTYQN